jgi:hypothetical protein
VIDLQYTGLVTRTDTYEPDGAVLVNGAIAQTFTGPSKGPSDPHPTGGASVTLSLLAGAHTVEVVFPYCASIDFEGIMIPSGASVSAAPARPTAHTYFVGDSIIQGFNATAVTASWVWLLSQAKGWQLFNHGYGGRVIEAGDATIAGAAVADQTVTNIGINNCFAGSSAAAIQSAAEAFINAHRAAATSSGQATKPLYWVNLFDCVNPGLVTDPATARGAIAAAFAAIGGPYDFLIPGGTAGGLPAASTFTDLTHPDDAEAVTIANVLGGLIA